MIEHVTEAIAALQSETVNYPQSVQIWMKLMGISFMASLVFILSGREFTVRLGLFYLAGLGVPADSHFSFV